MVSSKLCFFVPGGGYLSSLGKFQIFSDKIGLKIDLRWVCSFILLAAEGWINSNDLIAQVKDNTIPLSKDVANPIIQNKEDLEAALEESYGVQIGEEYNPPTEEEQHVLRKVAGRIPAVAYLLCIVELAERASYYGVNNVFNNYLEFPLPEGGDGTGAVAPGHLKYDIPHQKVELS